MYDKGEEIPLVGMYRKELAGELLAMSKDDTPKFTTEQEWSNDRQRRDMYQPGVMQVWIPLMLQILPYCSCASVLL